MKVFTTEKGQGKSALIINRALYCAAENQMDDILVVAVNQKKAALLKKRATEENGGILPKNIDFVGADTLFSRGASRVKKRNLTRFFFDDVDDTLKVMCEKVINGKVVMEMASATEKGSIRSKK